MNKESASWLLVRFLGVCFLIAAIYCLYEVVLNILLYLYLSLSPSLAVAISEDGTTTLKLYNFNWDELIDGCISIVFTVYFLKYGNFIHRLLMNEASKNTHT